MPIMFAYVKYLTDNVKAIVPIAHVKHFQPEDEDDFVKTRVYRVLWQNDEDDGEYYKAQILLLGESEERIENQIKCSRVKVTKVLDTSVEDTTDDEALTSSVQKSMKACRTEKKVQKISKASAEKASLEAVLKAKKRKPLYLEVNETDRPTGNKAHEESYKQKYIKIKEKNSSLKEELENYRALNRRLQEALLDKVSDGSKKSKPTPNSGKNSPRNQEVDQPTTADDLEVKDGEVELGAGITMDASKWSHLQRISKPSLFVKSLVVAVWGSDTLMNRSVEGKVCPRFAKDGREARQALTPQKYNALKERFVEYLKKTGNDCEKEVKFFNKYINEKISDINRAAKKRKLDFAES